MTTPAELNALAERVEQATVEKQHDAICSVGKAVFPYDCDGSTTVRRVDFVHLVQAGAYLDAAMSLVPEGMDWFRERGAYVPFIVSVDGPTCRFVSECDSSLPLALCAAALRARAAELAR